MYSAFKNEANALQHIGYGINYDKLIKLMNKTNDRMRIILMLRYCKNMDYADIDKRIGINDSKILIYNWIKMIKKNNYKEYLALKSKDHIANLNISGYVYATLMKQGGPFESITFLMKQPHNALCQIPGIADKSANEIRFAILDYLKY